MSASTMQRAEVEIDRLSKELEMERSNSLLQQETSDELLSSTIEKYENLKHDDHVKYNDIIEKLKLELIVIKNEKLDLKHQNDLYKKDIDIQLKLKNDENMKLTDSYNENKLELSNCETLIEEQRNLISENSIKIASLEVKGGGYRCTLLRERERGGGVYMICFICFIYSQFLFLFVTHGYIY